MLVDVDGVVSLWGFPADARPAGTFASIDGIVHFLSAAAGQHLRDLSGAFELAWCSGWEEKANDYLPLLLGVGPLPVVAFRQSFGPPTAHWKLAGIDAFAGTSRPLAWIDDALDDRCREWARARRAPTLLVGTQPATGLTAAEAAILTAWAGGLKAVPRPGS